MAAPTQTAKGTRKQCTKCGERPRAYDIRAGERRRTKLCKACLRERREARAEAAREGAQQEALAQQDITNFCGARKKNGKPCENTAGAGTDHPGYGTCKWHGGATPNARKAAAKAQAHASALVMGAPIDIAPHEALLWCVRIAAGEVSYCNIMVATLTRVQAIGRQVSTKERPVSFGKDGESETDTVIETTIGDPALHIWITTRRDAIDRLAKFSKLAIDAGIAERQVQIVERLGEQIGRAIGGILDGLKLSASQQKRAPELVRMHLTQLEGTATEEVA